MKILAFVDLHGSESALRELKQKTKRENPELILCAGDISIFEQDLKSITKKLDRLNKPLLIIPGNHETESALRPLCNKSKNIKYIDKTYFIHKNYLFLGYELDSFSPIDINFKKTEKGFLKIISKNKDKKLILINHAPPYNTNVDKLIEEHAGNKTIRNFIEKVKPDLVICGHLHENFGKRDRINNSIIINPGPFGEIIEV